MDWTNERYVKLYTRDTTAMLMLAWDELALFWSLLRKVDRAGTLDLEGYGMHAVSVHLRCPLDVAERAVAAWVKVGWVEMAGDDTLVVPSHLPAQDANKSDKLRQAELRERRREDACAKSAKSGENVTIRDETSRDVTQSHTASRLAEPSLAEPSLAKQEKGAASVPGPSASEVKEVWEHFLSCRRRVTTSGAPMMNDTRRTHIKARLRSYGKARVMAAVSAFLARDSWHVANGRIQPELVFRSDEQLEKHETSQGDRSEADHESQKARIAAEYRADQARIAREQGEAAPVDLIRKLTAGIGRPVGG